MKLSLLPLFIGLISIGGTFPTQAHPGRTDSSGCHTNRKTGEYHCHGGSGSSGGGSSTTPTNAPPRSAPDTPPPANDSLMYAKIVSVGDGDTFRASSTIGVFTTRLACIDAAELNQVPYGQMASNRLKQLLPVGETVTIKVVDTDRYGRKVAEVWRGKTSINLTMVQEGMAVTYPQYLNNCPQLKSTLVQAEKTAKQKKLGFWQQANPKMPYDFRRGR